MRTLQEWMDAYGESHQNPTNKTIHWICVPIIYITVIGLFASIPSAYLQEMAPTSLAPFAHWGTIVILLGLIFYLRLSFTMFIAITIWSAFSLWIVSLLLLLPYPLWASSTLIFILAWIGQFYGHKVEGAKPSFFEDLQFLLIGPAWLIGFILNRLGIKY